MTERELAQIIRGRSTEEFVQRWVALAEMTEHLGLEAVLTDFTLEGQENDRKYEVWQILVPYMKAGVHGWHDLHEALTPEEHERIEALIRGG